MKHAAGADMSDVTSLGEITAEGLRQVFPQWRIFGAGGAWWATRGGLQHWTGPESLLLRVISAADLIALAERLCVQSWLDGLDDKALAAVYEGRTSADSSGEVVHPAEGVWQAELPSHRSD